jgi:LysR family transcriptional regulator, cell division regulator
MDASDLEIFECVARYGSMSKATFELHTVQSNITTRIRALEDELGIALFNRTNRGVLLSAAGKRLLPFAWRMSQLIYDARNAVNDAGEPAGVLTLGAMGTTAATRLAKLSSDYAVAYPLVRMSIETSTSQTLIERVLDHKLEGAFVAGPLAAHRDLVSRPAFHEQVAVITSRRVTSLDAMWAAGEVRPVVFGTGCWYRTMLESLVSSMQGTLSSPLEFGSVDAILECVAAGAGIALLPRGGIERAIEPSRFIMHPLPTGTDMVDTVFVRRADAYVSNALRAYLDLIVEKEAITE